MYTWECNTGGSQNWDWVPSGYSDGRMLRLSGTNMCIDAYNSYNGRAVYTWDCSPTASNHNWYHGNLGYNNLVQQNTNQCLDAYNAYNGRDVYTWQCANVNNHHWIPEYLGTW